MNRKAAIFVVAAALVVGESAPALETHHDFDDHFYFPDSPHSHMEIPEVTIDVTNSISASGGGQQQSEHHQPAMYEIVPSGDYVQVVCVKCHSDCKVDYKGLDPSIPLLEITCPKCGPSGSWKLDGAGSGFYTRTHDL